LGEVADLRFLFTFQRTLNFTDHIVHVFQHIMVPKTQDFVPALFKEFSALRIVFFLFQVLASIQFEDEFAAWSTEIYYVITDGVLPSELYPD